MPSEPLQRGQSLERLCLCHTLAFDMRSFIEVQARVTLHARRELGAASLAVELRCWERLSQVEDGLIMLLHGQGYAQHIHSEYGPLERVLEMSGRRLVEHR